MSLLICYLLCRVNDLIQMFSSNTSYHSYTGVRLVGFYMVKSIGILNGVFFVYIKSRIEKIDKYISEHEEMNRLDL